MSQELLYDPAEVNELLPKEQEELAECEQVIERNFQAFYDTGMALLTIKDKQLYRETHSTFEEYCRERWGLSRPRAYQLIDAANVVDNLSTSGRQPESERHARPLASLEPEFQREAWQKAVETAPNGKITASHIESVVEEFKPKASHQYINSSESCEWYTPKIYVDAVRELFGEIDLDPAGCELANRTIQARQYFAIEDDGLSKAWPGRVFLNPPYGFAASGESNQALWSKRLIQQFKAGITEEGVLLVNAVTGNKWFAALWDYPICFPDHRIRFYNEETEAGQPTHSNALVYLGKQIFRFGEIFSRFGTVAEKMRIKACA